MTDEQASSDDAAKEMKPDSELVPLVCAVCDIRGFTGLTQRVDTFLRETGSVGEGERLFSDYSNLIWVTQETAVACLWNQVCHRIANGEGQDGRPAGWFIPREKIKYAVKGTGDGLLVAFRADAFGDGTIGSLQEEDSREHVLHWVAAVAEAMFDLIVVGKPTVQSTPAERAEEHPEGKGDCGGLQEDDGCRSVEGEMRRFLEVWGERLGLRSSLGNDDAKFRLAGALTLGFGILREEQQQEIRDSTAGPTSKGDAFGHCVNLAFRLCDRAGRKTTASETPKILVDRRAATMLLDESAVAALRDWDHQWRLRAYEDPLRMKGLEESWCFQIL